MFTILVSIDCSHYLISCGFGRTYINFKQLVISTCVVCCGIIWLREPWKWCSVFSNMWHSVHLQSLKPLWCDWFGLCFKYSTTLHCGWTHSPRHNTLLFIPPLLSHTTCKYDVIYNSTFTVQYISSHMWTSALSQQSLQFRSSSPRRVCVWQIKQQSDNSFATEMVMVKHTQTCRWSRCCIT